MLSVAAHELNSQDLKWGKMLGSDKQEYVLSHVTDNNGRIFVSGKTKGDIDGRNLGQNDCFLICLDSSGNELWKKQFGSEGDEDIQWSAIDKPGNIYLAGYTTGTVNTTNTGKEDIIVYKFSPEGKSEWIKQIGTDSTDIAKGICTDLSGNVYVIGLTSGIAGSASYGKTDCVLIKMDNEGNILKTVQFGTPEDDMGYSIAAGVHNDVFVCGTTWGNISGQGNGMVDGFAGRFSSSLEKQELFQFGTNGFDIPLVICADNEDHLYVGGSTSGNFASDQAGEGDCFVLKMNFKDGILWKKQFGTTNHDGIRGIDINENISKNLYISGIMSLPPEKAFVMSYNPDGDLLWQKTFEAQGIEGGTSGKDIHINNDGTLTHIGLTHVPLFGPLWGGDDVYVLKMGLK